MPSPEKRVRVERGLYKTGKLYYACATPPASRTAVWKALGPVNLMEARRLRDKFCADVQGAPALALANPRRTFGDLAGEWLEEQRARMEAGEMSPRTYEIYETGLRLHVLPVFANRQVRGVDAVALVAWIRGMRSAGYAPHSVHNYWGGWTVIAAWMIALTLLARAAYRRDTERV